MKRPEAEPLKRLLPLWYPLFLPLLPCRNLDRNYLLPAHRNLDRMPLNPPVVKSHICLSLIQIESKRYAITCRRIAGRSTRFTSTMITEKMGRSIKPR